MTSSSLLGATSTKTIKPIHYFARAAALAIPALLIGCQILGWVAALRSPILYRDLADFREFYVVGTMLREGHRTEIYQRISTLTTASAVIAPGSNSPQFSHPAYESLLFVPLAFLPLHAAYLVWLGVQMALVLVVCRVLKPQLTQFSEVGLPLLMAIVGFYPVLFAMFQGQDSLVVLLLLVCALNFVKRDALFLVGLIIGFGVFRFQLLLPIVLLFTAWRLFALLRGFLLSTAACFVVSVAVASLHGQMDLIHELQSLTAPNDFRALTMPNLRGLIAGLRGGIDSPGLTLAGSVIVLAIAWGVGRHREYTDKFLLSVIASCLVSYHFFGHDIPLLIFPLLAMIDSAIERRNYYVLAVLATLLSLPLALTMNGMPGWMNSAVPFGAFILACAFTPQRASLGRESPPGFALEAVR